MQNDSKDIDYSSTYWDRWFFKARRANEIIAALPKSHCGGDLLWNLNRKWFKFMTIIPHPGDKND